MTVMHIDFRIPIVPNGSCYGSYFEVFEIFFKSIATVHHYIGYYLLNATHSHSTSSQRNLCRFFLLSTMQKGLQMKSLKHTSTKKKPNTYNARVFEHVMANHTKKATVSLQTINWHK